MTKKNTAKLLYYELLSWGISSGMTENYFIVDSTKLLIIDDIDK